MSEEIKLPSRWTALLSSPFLRMVGSAGFKPGQMLNDYRHMGFEVGNHNFDSGQYTEEALAEDRAETAGMLVAYTDTVLRMFDTEYGTSWRMGRSEEELRWEVLTDGRRGRMRRAGWMGTDRDSPDYLWIELWSIHPAEIEPGDRLALEGFAAGRLKSMRTEEEAELRLGRAAVAALRQLKASVDHHDGVLDGDTGKDPESPTGDDYNEVVGMVRLAAGALDA